MVNHVFSFLANMSLNPLWLHSLASSLDPSSRSRFLNAAPLFKQAY